MLKFIIGTLSLLLVSTSVSADDSCTTTSTTEYHPIFFADCTRTITECENSNSQTFECPGITHFQM